MADLIRRNKLFYAAYALLIVSAGLCLLLFSKTELFVFINGNRSPVADFFYYYLTALGDGWFFVALILGLTLLKFRYAVAAASTYALSSLLAQGLKRLLFSGEPRPFEFFKHTTVRVFTAPGNELLSFNSFPSGHTTTVFAIACLFSLTLENKKLSLLMLLLAILTGFSRLYLGQHFFADITTGSLIGVSSATICYYFTEKSTKPWLEKKLF